jgi:hypothetical protein
VEFVIEFGGSPQDLTITASGIADVTGYLRMYSALTADPRFRPGFKILVEQPDLDMTQCSDADVEQIAASLAARDWNYPPRAVAVVVSATSVEGARLGTLHLGGTKSGRRLFESRDEALAWLAEQT